MKIDLHVHCSEYSPCAVSTMHEQIQAAIGAGLDALVFTNHHRLISMDELIEVNHMYYPFRIFNGIEITINKEDLLVYGIQDPVLEQVTWTYPDLYQFVRENHGFIALAHPYRYGNRLNLDIETYTPDAMEVHSSNIGKDDEQRIRNLAMQTGCRLITNSDAHQCSELGLFYNDVSIKQGSIHDITLTIKAGNFQHFANQTAIEKYNRKVQAREQQIREMMEESISVYEYERITGLWGGYYMRVKRGKSYQI